MSAVSCFSSQREMTAFTVTFVCVSRPRHIISTIEAIINEAKSVPAILPNVTALQESLAKAQEWISHVESLQSADQFPYLETLESLVNSGRPIPVRLELLPQVCEPMMNYNKKSITKEFSGKPRIVVTLS